MFFHSFSCFLLAFVSFCPLTKGFSYTYYYANRKSERERESREKKLVELLCTHTMVVHYVDVAAIWTQNRRISHFVFRFRCQ